MPTSLCPGAPESAGPGGLAPLVCDAAVVAPDFHYSNRSERPRGPVLSALSAVFPGIRAVQDQVQPYAVWWEAHNRRALTQPGPLWVALGDSMTQGIGASAPDRGWVGQLSGRLTARGWDHRLVNLGVNGARVEDVLDRQLPTLEALTTPPVLVTVVIGSNDVVVRRHRRGLVERFEQLLDRLPAGALVSNLPNPAPRGARRRRHAARARRRGAPRPRRHAPRRPALVARATGLGQVPPNDLGYADMASVVERAVDRADVVD